jgi:hypothetical protein
VFQFRDSTTFTFESDISKVRAAQQAAIRTAMAKARFVRTAALWPTKMLHNVLNGCFGEAAVQHLGVWPKAGVGRSC